MSTPPGKAPPNEALKMTEAAGRDETMIAPGGIDASDSRPDAPGGGADDAFAPGTLAFDRYRIERELGRGGMGAVYLARDEQLDRQVALKVPSAAAAADPELAERFLREARAAATLRHPHLCPTYDAGQQDGQLFMTMAFLSGDSLRDAIRGPQPVRSAVRLVGKLADAMAHAHDQGVVHRDLKPGNVMLDKRGRPHVTDFGLARRDSEDARVTRSGTMLGTPAYMSPEQILGDQDKIGPQTDVYALGVILYELLTGRLPYDGTVTAVLGKALSEDPPPPGELRGEVDPALEAIWRRMTARNTADRYANMHEVRDALAAYLKDGPKSILANRPSPGAAPAPAVAPRAPVLPTRSAPARRSRKRTAAAKRPAARKKEQTVARLWWGAAAAGALVLLGVVTIVFLSPDGSEQTLTVDVPGDVTGLSIDNAGGGEGTGDPAGGADGGQEVQEVSVWTLKPDADGWVNLFNGRDLTGWRHVGGTWTVERGELVGQQTSTQTRLGAATLHWAMGWVSEEDFPVNYEFEVELAPASPGVEANFVLRASRSGSVLIKNGAPPDDFMGQWGRVQSHANLRDPESRFLHLPAPGEANSGLVDPRVVRRAVAAAERADGVDWHRVRVRFLGNKASLTVNGIDFGGGTDPDMSRGQGTSLKVHRPFDDADAPLGRVRYRSIRLRPLTPEGEPVLAAAAAADG